MGALPTQTVPAPPTSVQIRNQAPSTGPERAWRQLAWIAGAFSLLVCLILSLQQFRAKVADPFKSAKRAQLQEQLLLAPKDEALKAQIRMLDLQLRAGYFKKIARERTGAWLALGGAALFVLGSRQARRLRERLPMPGPNPDAAEQLGRTVRWARWSVAGIGLAAAVTVGTVAHSARTSLPIQPVEIEKFLRSSSAGLTSESDFVAWAELSKHWTGFRGPDGSGSTAATNLPVAWNVGTSNGLAWVAEVPAAGFNSPIVWQDRIFLSGGDASKQEVFCFDANAGTLLWRQSVPSPAPRPIKAPEIPEQTGYAASTMATDGRRVFAIFANGTLASLTLDGKLIWSKALGFPKNPHGHATSLLARQGRLIVQLDQGEAEQSASRLFAFDGASGRIIWERTRPSPTSWATPILIEAAGKLQIVTLGVPWVIAYAFEDGTEQWRVEGLANEVTPSPIFAGGLVFAISPNEKLLAIRPDGQGDVTKTHVAWAAEENVPDISSPVSNGDLIFTVSTPGVLTCYDAKNGAKQWEHDLGMECQVSPSLAGGRLYLIGTKGMAVVVEASRAFHEVARSDFHEQVFASPAFRQDHMIVRGAKHLFCLGPTPLQTVRRD